MTVIGSKSNFAIQYEVSKKIKGYALGNFYFWIDGIRIGDENDDTHIDACVNWLDSLVNSWSDLYSPSEYHMLPNELFEHYFFSCERDEKGCCLSSFKNDPGKTYISHVGMSSFEEFDLFLISNDTINCRFLWRSPEGLISTFLANEECVKETISKAVSSFRRSASSG